MKNSIIITILIFTLCYINYADAITLQDAIKKALSSSDQARVIEESRKYSDAEAKKVDAFTKPQIDTAVKYYELGTTAEDSIFMTNPDRQMTTELTASKLLWSGNRIKESRSLKDNLIKLAKIEENSMKRDLSKQVSNAFLQVLYQQARIDVLKDRVKQRNDELNDAADLFEAGMVTNLDVREAKLQLHVAKDALSSGESEFHTALVDFNLVIGESGEKNQTLLVPEGGLVRVTTHKLNEKLIRLETLYKEKGQIDIKKAMQSVDIAQKNLNLAKDGSKPILSLVAAADYEGEKTDNMEASWNVGAQMSWNFYDGGTINADIASANANKKSREAALHQAEKSISGSLNKLKAEVDSLNKRIKLQEETVALSNGNYEDARGLYLNGTITLTRVGDFNLLYAEARFNLLQLYYLENVMEIEVKSLICELP